MGLDCIPQASRSAVIANEDTIPVYRIVQNAGGSHSVHDHRQVLVASGNEYINVRNVVTD